MEWGCDQEGVFESLRQQLHVQVDDAAFTVNEAILERVLAVDDVDAVHTNCAGLQH